MKLPLQNIDEYESFFSLRCEIAKELGVALSDAVIYNHSWVGEWVINIKGKFSGYVEDYL